MDVAALCPIQCCHQHKACDRRDLQRFMLRAAGFIVGHTPAVQVLEDPYLGDWDRESAVAEKIKIHMRRGQHMPKFTTKDGTEIYYKDWGNGQPVVFSHGWPLSSDAWDAQMIFLASHGFRCIAHDRRGHGRSDQPWDGHDMDTYADDLAELTARLNLQNAIHIGHSTGGGEVARYIARHGTKRVAKAVLISAVPPLMLQTANNPAGQPMSVFDDLRAKLLQDRSQFFIDLSAPFFGANRPNAKVSQGMRDSFWLQGMMAGHKAAYECIKAFSETDQTEDLKKFDVPTLIMHGTDDQIVPVGASAMMSSKLVKHAQLKLYDGAPHGMPVTHAEQVNSDLLAFLQARDTAAA
jgi:non-heme chloroperoxidase